MSTKHTPGPWEQMENGFWKQAVRDARGRWITYQAGDQYSMGRDEVEANARLIAAAPELLEALKWYVENDDTNIGMEGNEFWEEGLERGKAAIAKATGEA